MLSRSRCALCGDTRIAPYFANDQRILRCITCGIGFLVPELTIKDLGAYYTERSYENTFLDKDRYSLAQENARAVLRFMTRYIRDCRGKTLFDIGAHSGAFVAEATRAGFRARGLEPNTHLVKEAHARGTSLSPGSLEQLTTSERFDIIILSHVLEHLPDPIAAIRKVHALLKEDGFFVLEVPNSESYLALRHGVSWKFIALEHLFYFSEKTLPPVLKKQGFRLIALKRRNFEIHSFGIRRLLEYLGGRSAAHDRFYMKSQAPVGVRVPPHSELGAAEGIKRMVRKLLVWFITFLGRGDHILVIAQKV